MKKILLSVGIIAIVAVGAIGATRAYFSNTATVTGNTFTAGTMDLKIDQTVSGSTYSWVDSFDTTSETFRDANGWTNAQWSEFLAASGMKDLYPGVEKQQIMDIKNVGTVNGYATIKLSVPTWSTSAMGEDLHFAVYYDNTTTTASAFNGIRSGTLATLKDNVIQLGTLAKGQQASVKIVWSVPTTVGNEIMGATASVNTVFGLNQIANQPEN